MPAAAADLVLVVVAAAVILFVVAAVARWCCCCVAANAVAGTASDADASLLLPSPLLELPVLHSVAAVAAPVILFVAAAVAVVASVAAVAANVLLLPLPSLELPLLLTVVLVPSPLPPPPQPAQETPTEVWRGAMTLPRELSLGTDLLSGRTVLYQQPVPELQAQVRPVGFFAIDRADSSCPTGL